MLPVSLKSGEETIQAYLALPEKPAKGGPAIAVIHEWWGLSDRVKGVADRYAVQGYVAIAPDLKSRKDLAPSSALSNRAPVM